MPVPVGKKAFNNPFPCGRYPYIVTVEFIQNKFNFLFNGYLTTFSSKKIQKGLTPFVF
jgi:hypothetical protein